VDHLDHFVANVKLALVLSTDPTFGPVGSRKTWITRSQSLDVLSLSQPPGPDRAFIGVRQPPPAAQHSHIIAACLVSREPLTADRLNYPRSESRDPLTTSLDLVPKPSARKPSEPIEPPWFSCSLSSVLIRNGLG
jgi:hypothetical protein